MRASEGLRPQRALPLYSFSPSTVLCPRRTWRRNTCLAKAYLNSLKTGRSGQKKMFEFVENSWPTPYGATGPGNQAWPTLIEGAGSGACGQRPPGHIWAT